MDINFAKLSCGCIILSGTRETGSDTHPMVECIRVKRCPEHKDPVLPNIFFETHTIPVEEAGMCYLTIKEDRLFRYQINNGLIKGQKLEKIQELLAIDCMNLCPPITRNFDK